MLAMARQGLTMIPVMYLFSCTLGLNGLVWAQPLADTLAFVISIPFVAALFRKMKLKERRQTLETVTG